MHEYLSSLLRSPHTGESYSLEDDGNTLLTTSGEKIPVVESIPRFIEDNHLESFGLQWTTYEVAHDDEDKATFEAKTGMKLYDLKGLKILDAGCGGGRYCKVAGEAGATVIGVDHTRAVNKAKKLCQHLPDVHFVQGDLKQLPFEPASFDAIFSIGVMHHDSDTRRVFDAVAKFVKSGGRYSVWLYKRNQWWQEAINNFLRKRTTKMESAKLEKWCKWGAFFGGLPVINRTLNKIVNFSAHPSYENRVCDTFDWYAPEYQYHHTISELENWFKEAGFTDCMELPPEKTGAFYRWIYRQNLLIGSGVNMTAIRQ